MSNKHYTNIFILLMFFCIGIWEANIASSHQPDKVKLTGYETEAYAFTVVKSILNILFGVFGVCLFMKESENDEKKSNMSQIHCINLGVVIWCIIMYSDIINHHIDFGPFKKVIVAEFIIFITSACLLVFSCCVAVIFVSVTSNQTSNRSLDHDVTKISDTIEKLKTKIGDTSSNHPIVSDPNITSPTEVTQATESPILTDREQAKSSSLEMIDIVIR